MKARAIYQLALKGEPVDPILFVNNIELIHRQLLPNELDIFINELNSMKLKLTSKLTVLRPRYQLPLYMIIPKQFALYSKEVLIQI